MNIVSTNTNSVLQGFKQVGFFTAISRILGLVRDVFLALALGAGLASDAFIPFPDSLEIAAENGIFNIIQPGGSKKDKEIIETANRLNQKMVFTKIRHFSH